MEIWEYDDKILNLERDKISEMRGIICVVLITVILSCLTTRFDIFITIMVFCVFFLNKHIKRRHAINDELEKLHEERGAELRKNKKKFGN